MTATRSPPPRAQPGVVWELDADADALAPGPGASAAFDAWRARLHPDDREEVLASLEAALEADDRWASTHRLARDDGSYREVEVHARIVRGEDGRARRVVGVALDVTQARENERAIVQARDRLARGERLLALGTLVSGVAHEVRTPLAYIATNLHLVQGALEAAAERGAPADQALAAAQPLLDEAMQGVDRINRLVLELRRFTRGPVGERARVSLHEPVARAVAVFTATRRGRVEVRADLAPTGDVIVDEGKVQQVVLNLLENAAEAAPGAPVRVATHGTPDGPCLVVADDGPGIPDPVKARMFEAFFTTKPEGTGLGLAIVRRIAEEHGARIDVETAPGAGTRVLVTFRPAQ